MFFFFEGLDSIDILVPLYILYENYQDIILIKSFFGDLHNRLQEVGSLKVDTVKKIWANCEYPGEELARWIKDQVDCFYEVVAKQKTADGFHVLPLLSRRWIEERNLVWLGRFQRLSKDHERKTTSSTGHVYLASSRLMLRRIRKERALFQKPLSACLGN